MSLAKIIALSVVYFGLAGCSWPTTELTQRSYEQPETGVYGRVESAAEDLPASTWVYAYRSRRGGFRGPADFAARVDADGGFLLDLLPGRWFLVARSRLRGPLTGPPQKGDAWAIYPDNPLVLRQSEVRRVDLQLRLVVPSMLLRGGLSVRGDSGFRGRLLGPGNIPVAGAMALAYRNLDYRRMPDYSSAAVSADGHFLLYVPAPGRYCLVARQGTRGQPRQGELYGLLGVAEAGCRELSQGEMLDVGTIHLTPYLP
ncbi:MAG: hypothetical protein GXP51_05985 [Deltaproteobacteria bacterium]|nr:hypothetical protein [Deltaproteobacteria bacterium]